MGGTEMQRAVGRKGEMGLVTIKREESPLL